MLSLQDCLDYADLDRTAIEAIAEHEHLPLIVAAQLGCTLMNCEWGIKNVQQMMDENIEHALEHGHVGHAERLSEMYRKFRESH